jgi:hypothetical protein
VRLLVTAAVLVIATTADAQDDDKPEVQRMRLVETETQLTVTTLPPPDGGIGKIFDLNAYAALRHAPKTRVVVRIQITPQNSDVAVAERVLDRTVVFEMWNEKYEVQLDEPAGKRTLHVRPQSEALKWLTAIDDVPVAPLSVLPIKQVFVLKMIVELNPATDEELAEVRRGLSRGNGGGIDRGGGLFGSFVTLFYNPKFAKADRILRFQSQPFYRPGP